MAKYRKKPIVIEAQQWHTGDPPIGPMRREGTFLGGVASYEIPTLEGAHLVTDGDWIIKGIAGEFYPCKPDIFEQTYEPAS